MLAATLSLMGADPAAATFLTYWKWQSKDIDFKAAYVSGMMDSYVTFSADYRKTSLHFETCLQRLDVTNYQLADGLSAFAETRPAEQVKPLPAILFDYLDQTCGKPPS